MCRCDVSWRKPWLWALAVIILIGAAVMARADEGDPELKPGQEMPGPFRPWTFTGKHLDIQRKRILATIRENDAEPIKQFKQDLAKNLDGNYHCPLTEQGLNPVALIFVKGTDASPALTQLLQKVDESVARHERDRLAAYVVFLDDKVKDVSKDDEARFTGTAALEPKLNQLKGLTAALDGYEEVAKQFKLSDKADVSLVLFDRYKVIGTRGLKNEGLDDKGVATVLNDLEALIAASKKAAIVGPMK